MDMAKNTITEATKLILNNKTCMLKLVSFLLVVPLFLLNLLHSLVARPLLQRVEEAYETSSSSLKSLNPDDIRSLLALEIPFFIAFSALWLFQTATTVAAAASAYAIATYNTTTTTTVGSLHLKDLVLTWINSTYKKVLYAWLFALLAISAFVALFLAAFALLPQSNLLIAASSAVAALANPYLDSICALGLVISVLEDSCRGARHCRKPGD